MHKEATDELAGFERHRPMLILPLAAVIFPFEGDNLCIKAKQPGVGDGDTVCIARQISQYCLGASERTFRIDNPLGLARWREVLGNGAGIRQGVERPAEVEVPRVESLLERVEQEATEQAGQHADREEEPWTAADPSSAIRGQATARDDAVEMRVMHEGLPPRMQDGKEADVGAQMGWIGRDRAERRGGRAEQEALDDGFVLQRVINDN